VKQSGEPVTGWPVNVLDDVKTKLSQIVRSDHNVKKYFIGIASHGNSGVEDRYKKKYEELGYSFMKVLYTTESDENRKLMEQALICLKRSDPRLANASTGGEGPEGKAPYSVYVAIMVKGNRMEQLLQKENKMMKDLLLIRERRMEQDKKLVDLLQEENKMMEVLLLIHERRMEQEDKKLVDLLQEENKMMGDLILICERRMEEQLRQENKKHLLALTFRVSGKRGSSALINIPPAKRPRQ